MSVFYMPIQLENLYQSRGIQKENSISIYPYKNYTIRKAKSQ